MFSAEKRWGQMGDAKRERIFDTPSSLYDFGL